MGAIKPWHLIVCFVLTVGAVSVIVAAAVVLIKRRR
jgi:hypothetical protein